MKKTIVVIRHSATSISKLFRSVNFLASISLSALGYININNLFGIAFLSPAILSTISYSLTFGPFLVIAYISIKEYKKMMVKIKEDIAKHNKIKAINISNSEKIKEWKKSFSKLNSSLKKKLRSIKKEKVMNLKKFEKKYMSDLHYIRGKYYLINKKNKKDSINIDNEKIETDELFKLYEKQVEQINQNYEFAVKKIVEEKSEAKKHNKALKKQARNNEEIMLPYLESIASDKISSDEIIKALNSSVEDVGNFKRNQKAEFEKILEDDIYSSF